MKKALVTLTIGPAYTEMARLTHPLMQRYANRCSADFVVIDQRKVNEKYDLSERYEKFQVFDLIDHYDQIAFIDTDILVSPTTPSVFELTPLDRFSAASEASYSMAGRDQQITQQELGPVSWSNPYFNSGMMVFSKAHKSIFDPVTDSLRHWSTGEFRQHTKNLLNDQPYLNHRLHVLGIPLLDLGYRFNHTRVIRKTQLRFRSHMIHYAGPSGHRYGSRIEQIRKDARVLDNRAALWLSQVCPPLRWLGDRLDSAYIDYLLRERKERR